MFWNYVFVLLARWNVLFVKLFQALSSNNYVSDDAVLAFKSFTNSARFYEKEVDYALLDKIVKQYQIELYDNKPINAGMISVVFKGKMNGKDVAIKLKRIDIYNRLQKGYKEFGRLYWFAYYVLRIFRMHNLLDTIASFVESEDYILTQCEFKDEIFAMKTVKRELQEFVETGNITKADRLIIPTVYNDPDETEYIIMEFINGKSSFEIPKEDRNEYLYIVGVYTSLALLFSVQHTDLHPGNLIFTEEDGVKKIGVIDFGMFIVNTPKITNALFQLASYYTLKRDLTYDYFQHTNSMLEPMLDATKLTKQQFSTLNAISRELITDMVEGRLSEKIIRTHFNNMCAVTPELSPKFDITLVKILLGNTMACATAFSLTDDIALFGEFQKVIFKEIVS